MRCPKCKCEVGSQKMCPYCGASMETPEQRLLTRITDPMGKIYRYLRSLDTSFKDQSKKLNILLVLVCGNIVLTLLLLIAVFVK